MADFSRIGRRSRAKGKQFQKAVARAIAEHIGLPEDDVFSCVGGITERDIKLSAEAARRFPFHIECKNYKRWSSAQMKEWMAQAASEAAEGMTPIVVFKIHGDSTPIVALPLEVLLQLMY